MNNKIKQCISDKNWVLATTLLSDIITDNPSDLHSRINLIYLLHHILLEENFSDEEHGYFARLLEFHFVQSYPVFKDDAVYLFFIGQVLHIAEWYFGINEDGKSVTETLAYKMQHTAWQKEPNNVLYEWACRVTLGDNKAVNLAKQILSDDKIIVWIKSVLFATNYITEMLESTIHNQNLFMESHVL